MHFRYYHAFVNVSRPSEQPRDCFFFKQTNIGKVTSAPRFARYTEREREEEGEKENERGKEKVQGANVIYR